MHKFKKPCFSAELWLYDARSTFCLMTFEEQNAEYRLISDYNLFANKFIRCVGVRCEAISRINLYSTETAKQAYMVSARGNAISRVYDILRSITIIAYSAMVLPD